MQSVALERWKLTRYDASTERYVFSVPMMVLFAAGGAVLTGLLAQLRLPLQPVPFTGQVLAVLLCGSLLGTRYGLLSQLLYVGAGLAGVPWFSTSDTGMHVILGPTVGYLLGFIVAAGFLGFCGRNAKARTLEGQAGLMLAAVGIIYFFGIMGLMVNLHLGLWQALWAGALLFLPGDMFKAVMAAMLTSAVLPKAKR